MSPLIPAEAPEDRSSGAEPLFGKIEAPANRGLNTHHVKEVLGHIGAKGPDRRFSATRIDRPFAECSDMGTAVILTLPVLEVGLRDLHGAAGFVHFSDPGEAWRVGVRKRVEKDGFDDAEHRRVGSDAQRQGKNRGGSESRTLAEST